MKRHLISPLIMESAQASGSGQSHGRTLQQKIRDIIGVPLDEIEKNFKRKKIQNNHNFKTIPQRPRVDLNKTSKPKPQGNHGYQISMIWRIL